MPPGIVLPTAWLKRNAISNNLAYWYVKSGWLERICNGAYKKLGDTISWTGVVYSIQQLLELQIHIGAKTALQLLGRAHYIPLGELNRIFLFSEQHRIPTPLWLSNVEALHVEFLITNRLLTTPEDTTGIIERDFNGLKIRLSAPERAILEVMQLIPRWQTYEEAYLLMENLTNLRPKIVQELLEKCISIKAKRLFLHCADSCEHAWLNEVDLKSINLGSGKRKIGEGGVYDPKYQLSVPVIRSQ